ncbi:hypothetical protein AA0121_g13606 [Alternaria tenuissima]|nr:hypothetical protein AA0121_g13606 [Alternaria tenuissima]
MYSSSMRESVSQIMADYATKSRADADGFIAMVKNMEAELVHLTETLSERGKQVQYLTEKLEKTEGIIADREHDVYGLETETENRKKEIEKLEEKLSLQEKILQDCNDRLLEMENAEEKHQSDCSRAKKKAKDSCSHLQAELTVQHERNDELVKQLNDARDKIKKLKSSRPTNTTRTPHLDRMDTVHGCMSGPSNTIGYHDDDDHELCSLTNTGDLSQYPPTSQPQTVADILSNDLLSATPLASPESKKRGNAEAEKDSAETYESYFYKRRKHDDQRNVQPTQTVLLPLKQAAKGAEAAKDRAAKAKATKDRATRNKPAPSNENGLKFQPPSDKFDFKMDPTNAKTVSKQEKSDF